MAQGGKRHASESHSLRRSVRVIKRVLAAAFIAALLFAVPHPSFATRSRSVVAAAAVTYFNAESAAQAHCPRDVVVWLNIPSGIYHFRGERWYGRTKHGAYVCEKEAIAAGDRASRNGQ
jgi:hypothetical protein